MDGATALEYARSRHGTNDFARAGRQQKVLVGLRSRALQLNMLSRAPELVGIVRKSLSTDLSPVQMLALAKLISQVDRDRIANLVIDTSYANPFRGPDGADLLQPNIPAIKHAIESAQRSAAHPELRAKIEVLNGSGTAGLGQKAADYGADDSNKTKAEFARNCLLARRLLERGVRFVQLCNGSYAMGEGANVSGFSALMRHSMAWPRAVTGPFRMLRSDSPAAIRIWLLTRSTPVTASVTGCSTWIRALTSMKYRSPDSSMRNSTVPAFV